MHPMSVFVSSLIKYMSIKTSFSEYPQNTKHSKMNVDLDVYLFEYQWDLLKRQKAHDLKTALHCNTQI